MALEISPNNPAILNNMGLSYLMAGDKPNAAKYLRMAAAAPGADPRVQANLALVSDVPGGAAEAEAAPKPETAPKPVAAAEEVPALKPSADAPAKAEPETPPATGEPRSMATGAGASDLRGSN